MFLSFYAGLRIIHNVREADHERDNKGKHIDRRRDDTAYQSCNGHAATSRLYSLDFFERQRREHDRDDTAEEADDSKDYKSPCRQSN